MGLVRDATGRPIAGAAIFVRDGEGRLVDRFSMIVSGPDGSFRYSGVAPGEYTVSARMEGLASIEDAWVRVRAAEAAHVELSLGPGTMLIVQVVDRGGRDVEARISVRDGDGREMQGMIAYTEIMSSLGERFRHDEQRVGPLAPGSYEVVAEAPDGRRAKKPVTLDGRPERKLKLRLR